MRQISRIDFAFLMICSTVCCATVAQAQQGSKTAPRQVQAQVAPAGKPQPGRPPAAAAPTGKQAATPERKPAAVVATADDELAPDLEEILEKWEAASAKIKTIRGDQSRSEFISTFSLEKVSRGPFYLEMPDKGRIDMLAVHLKEGTNSKRINKETGKPYSIVSADQSDKWICDGESILQLTEKKGENEKKIDKTYQRVEIPPDQRGSNIVNTPLPFLLGIKAEEAKSRFQLKLKADSKEAALIYVTPRLEKDRQNYKMASITIDKKRYLPTQVRMIDDTGSDIVYTFENVVVNERKLLPEGWGWGSDPYHPNLKGWTLVVANEDPVDLPPMRNGDKKDPKRMAAELVPSNLARRTQPSNAASPGSGSIKK